MTTIVTRTFAEKINSFIQKNDIEHIDGQPGVVQTIELLKKLYPDNDLDNSGKPAYRHMFRMFLYMPYEKVNASDSIIAGKEKNQLNKDRAIVALLHDAVEDDKTTFDELRKLGYSDLNIERLEYLKSPDYPKNISTRNKHKMYDEYVMNNIRAPHNIAMVNVPVKFLDEKDNLSKPRMNISEASQKKFVKKYGEKNIHILANEVKKYTRLQDFSPSSKISIEKVIEMLKKSPYLSNCKE